jgi:hypothetical protein
MKIFPAYAKTLARYIAQGRAPRLAAVVVCADWSAADDLPQVCINPRDWAPDAYEFGYLRGLDVVLILGRVGERAAAQCICELLEAAPHDLVVCDHPRKPVADGTTDAWMVASGWFDAVCLRDMHIAGVTSDAIDAARAEHARWQARLRAVLTPVSNSDEALEAWFNRRHYLRQAIARKDEPSAA